MDNIIVAKIYYGLIDKDKYNYERLRCKMIFSLGYNKFRDYQSKAFELICENKKPEIKLESLINIMGTINA